MSSTLIGRGPALTAARAALDQALGGAGQLLLVSGDAGIGKSALLAEVAAEAGQLHARVLRGVCWDGDGTPAYWPWVQALRGAGVELGELAPAEAVADGESAAADTRFRLFDAVSRQLATLAARAPLVVVLDDLQWADEASLRLLAFVEHQLSSCRVLLLAAYRDAEAGPTLRGIVGRAHVLPLGGLTVDAVAELMTTVGGPRPSAAVAAQVCRRTGGNPFFVRELARLVFAQGGWDGRNGMVSTAIPDTVRDTVTRRLARLSAGCADVLAVAAVAGPEIRPELLATVLRPARPATDVASDVAELLDEAVRARVLVSAGGLVRFAHDLFRETIVAELPAARRSELHVAVGRALEALRADGVPVPAGELAAHFVAAGPAAVAEEAVRYSAQAGADATAGLGHEDACRHYERALRALDQTVDPGGRRIELLLALAAARERAGDTTAARSAYLMAARLAEEVTDPVGRARAAIGVHGLGQRYGASYDEAIELLSAAADALPAEQTALRARVLACLASDLQHSRPDYIAISTRAARLDATEVAEQAVELARQADDPSALAVALLAMHDVHWRPGTDAQRLAILSDMAAAAERAGDRDLVAQAAQLRAAALLEQGDPAGRAELSRYVQLAEELGHARGRWGALTRQATLACLAGRTEEALEKAAAALELGIAIGVPDARGCFGTLRGSLTVIGGPQIPIAENLDEKDPMRGLFGMMHAAYHLSVGDTEAAAAAIAGFTVDDIPDKNDLELVAFCSTVLAAVGSPTDREGAYQRWLPFAGLHVVVGGCAAYSGTVDKYLGLLAAATGRDAVAAEHHAAAAAAEERLGAPAWARLSRDELAKLGAASSDGVATGNVFRADGAVWTVAFAGSAVHLPDAKGLRDVATLLAVPGQQVHAFTLLGRAAPATGADPVLDERAKASFKARLVELDAEIDEAALWQDPARGERAKAERDALLRELASAAGLGGRDRRLGDEVERARKTVTARIRDALRRIGQVHPALAAHLHASLHTGTSCSYEPAEPTRWRL